MFETNFKRNGFFVEFGVCDGLKLSNTVVLEKNFGWSGIIAEPARSWHDALFLNRSCSISTKCVYGKSGERITFNETGERELSTIDSFSQSDSHAPARETGNRYEVETISLRDLLIERDAPRQIDYLSIDTEGSEFDIISNFNFDEFDVKLVSIEHNFTERREQIANLMANNGYRRVFSSLTLFDDWFIKL
ncbi:FkbM family methyltransferase [Methylobacterium sp. J-078]|uniref:FkbM family methyltransferase n=1 Tax=Methylobacterium sp. J-078 TaxID=2836657 RepID=UPI001FBB7F5B|nr:FkbM family methyltransferase [Methylobacterium sp. J-078]MCJ2042985.1 FkbM family methyltransferase [Methylobacterium sp. J-078]